MIEVLGDVGEVISQWSMRSFEVMWSMCYVQDMWFENDTPKVLNLFFTISTRDEYKIISLERVRFLFLGQNILALFLFLLIEIICFRPIFSISHEVICCLYDIIAILGRWKDAGIIGVVSGSSMLPWGTPDFIVLILETWPAILTYWRRFFK